MVGESIGQSFVPISGRGRTARPAIELWPRASDPSIASQHSKRTHSRVPVRMSGSRTALSHQRSHQQETEHQLRVIRHLINLPMSRSGSPAVPSVTGDDSSPSTSSTRRGRSTRVGPSRRLLRKSVVNSSSSVGTVEPASERCLPPAERSIQRWGCFSRICRVLSVDSSRSGSIASDSGCRSVAPNNDTVERSREPGNSVAITSLSDERFCR